VRPRRGAPVATPLRWEEVEDEALRPDTWKLGNVLERVEGTGDPWAGIGESAGRLPKPG
jgi:bifunctional non-homologous end joining protein LigD